MTALDPRALEAAMIAGWNACRKSIYAVCEDVQSKAEAALDKPSGLARDPLESQHERGFYRGEKSTAKSIARGFSAMEARDDDNLLAALASLPPAPAGSAGEETLWREMVQAHASAMRMVIDAIEHLFGPAANMESEDASLLRGPEPHHRAEGVIEALQRIANALAAAPPVQEPPKGWKWRMVPDYPEGDVVGACICGSWPGGKCLRCPPLSDPNDGPVRPLNPPTHKPVG